MKQKNICQNCFSKNATSQYICQFEVGHLLNDPRNKSHLRVLVWFIKPTKVYWPKQDDDDDDTIDY